MPNPAAIWWEAARPKTLWAAVSPVLIGIALAVYFGVFHALSASLALMGAILIQIGTNFFNDLADFKKGADTKERTGPWLMVQAGLVSEQAMRVATYATFGLAVLSGVYLMLRDGLPIVVIGFSSILFGIAYTGGKYSLAYLGIADVFVLVFFGPIAVAGTFFVQALEWPEVIWFVGLAPGLLAVAILLVNNIRDRVQDAKASKRTLVVRLGRPFAEWLYLACSLAAVFVAIAAWKFYDAPALILLSLGAFPLMIQSWLQLRSIPEHEAAKMNPILGQTARNLLVYSVLISLGWILGAA